MESAKSSRKEPEDTLQTPMCADPFLPIKKSLSAMEKAVPDCRGCPIYRNATQAVFGEGPKSARCMMVGEQPGNDEDLAGIPFVGPSGKLLDRALEEAGIDREIIYVTNAVKHFKNEHRGARRIHRSPTVAEIKACRPWLEGEIAAVNPDVIVCLGKSGARSVLDRSVTIKNVRGKPLESKYRAVAIVTVHPSSILRSPDDEARHRNYDSMVKDLKVVSEILKKS